MTDKLNTLVVDDEEGVRFFVSETLQLDGHTVTTASSGQDALNKLRDTAYDLIMLDLRLGGRIDGLRVLKAVRWRWPETVVIILTAHGSLQSAMTGIQEGVDGYLLKPVEPSDIRQAVVDALGRRERLGMNAAPQSGDALRRGPFMVDVDKHQVTVNDEPVELTPHEFRLLVHLIQNDDRVVEPPELVKIVRGFEPETLFEARDIIKWYIHRLRKRVEPDPSQPRYIMNVRGVGYTFGE